MKMKGLLFEGDLSSRDFTAEEVEILTEIHNATPPDRNAEGNDWAGEISSGVDCRGYISPDQKLMVFMYGDSGPHVVFISSAVAFGYSLGDAAPDWAKPS